MLLNVFNNYILPHTAKHKKSLFHVSLEKASTSGMKHIVPTYVGNTKASCSRSQISGSHPHLCGEYREMFITFLVFLEPPPLVRGILKHSVRNCLEVRATPTCAGNTNLRLIVSVIHQSHPHLCGEYEVSHRITIIHGATPTCAGNTVKAK